jgi:hypothetical protein
MDQALKTMINNMPEKTGKSLEEWIVVLKEMNFQKHMDAVKFLKSEHAVAHGFANTIVTLSKAESNDEHDLVAVQYERKEPLFTIYTKLIEVLSDFGDDVKVVPKKTTVSVLRKRQFALIKPATKTRIYLGLKLRGKSLTDRLQNSVPFGTMCTHRVQIDNLTQINEELICWLREAYTLSI